MALQVAERDQAAQVAARLSLLSARQQDEAEAVRLATLATEQAPAESILAQLFAPAAHGRAQAQRGNHREGEALVRQAIDTSPEGLLPVRALLHEVLAEVQSLAGRDTDANAAIEMAVTLHQRKGNLVAAASHADRAFLDTDARDVNRLGSGGSPGR